MFGEGLSSENKNQTALDDETTMTQKQMFNRQWKEYKARIESLIVELDSQKKKNMNLKKTLE